MPELHYKQQFGLTPAIIFPALGLVQALEGRHGGDCRKERYLYQRREAHRCRGGKLERNALSTEWPRSDKGSWWGLLGYNLSDQAVQCPYTYQAAHAFPVYALKSGLFRELGAGDQRQEGDIMSWPNHMAIYSSFVSDSENATTRRVNLNSGQKWTQKNDMWTASKPGGLPYGPAELRYWRSDAPRWFRYLK